MYEDLEDYEEIREYLQEAPAGLEPGAEHNFVPDVSGALIVEGLPVITKDKEEKMVAVLVKKLAGQASLAQEMVHVPYGSDGQSVGFAFVKAENEAEAKLLVKLIHGLEFSKKHILSAYPYSDLERCVGFSCAVGARKAANKKLTRRCCCFGCLRGCFCSAACNTCRMSSSSRRHGRSSLARMLPRGCWTSSSATSSWCDT